MTNSFTVQRERPSNRMSETAVVILVLRQIDFSGHWTCLPRPSETPQRLTTQAGVMDI